MRWVKSRRRREIVQASISDLETWNEHDNITKITDVDFYCQLFHVSVIFKCISIVVYCSSGCLSAHKKEASVLIPPLCPSLQFQSTGVSFVPCLPHFALSLARTRKHLWGAYQHSSVKWAGDKFQTLLLSYFTSRSVLNYVYLIMGH